MDSESNTSNLQRSIDQESIPSRRVALAWAYTRKGRPGTMEDPKLRYCLECEKANRLPIYATSVSTNQGMHLRSVHAIQLEHKPSSLNIQINDQLQQLYVKAESCGQTSELDTKVFQKHLDRDVVFEALLSLITVRSLPFRIVEWPEFHAFCRVLNPESKSALTVTHSHIRKKLEDSWISNQDIIRRKLQSALSSIHLSLDIWTSPQGYLLLGVVAHFIEQHDENHVKALLALRPVSGHSGDDQFNALLPILKDYGIEKQLGAIMGDNASSNDTLCRAIEAYLYEKESLEWDASQWRVRCLGHILNLSVQAFLFHDIFSEEELQLYSDQEALAIEINDEVIQKQVKFRLLGPLGQLHNIVVHIRRSPSRKAEFLALAGRMVPLDNATRWNSWYLMLEVALQHDSHLDTYSKAHLDDLGEDYLSL